MSDREKTGLTRGPGGLFAKGNSGGAGRPRGMDFRRVIEEHAAKNGVDLERAMWEVFLAMKERACEGDVAAAKLIVDKLCTADAMQVELLDSRSAGPVPPADVHGFLLKLAAAHGPSQPSAN